MKNIPLLVATILGTFLLVVGFAFFFSNSQSDPVTTTQLIDQNLLTESSRHSFGSETASLNIVEFSDYTCPYCANMQQILKQTALAYPADVKLHYLHFPLGSEFGQLAAQASEYAAEQGKFWEFSDLLYQNQQSWTGSGSIEEFMSLLTAYAEQTGVNTNNFQEQIQNAKYRDLVLADRSFGNSLEINATPTIFVNGQRLENPAELTNLIESLMSVKSDESQTQDLLEVEQNQIPEADTQDQE
jgi:protein-disulfide isomerase